MKPDRFYELTDRYLAGQATAQEQELIETYYYYLTRGRTERELAEEERMHTVVLQKIMRRVEEGVAATEAEQTAPVHYLPTTKRRWYWVAAAVLVLAMATTWLLVNKAGQHHQAITATADVAPGRPGAILKLADGRVINLDTARNGELFKGIDKTDSALTVTAAEAVEYATLETPRGRTIDLTLPDGSRVWLNAGSSIRFSTAFTGKERRVEMTGEAYFEVVHNAKSPFYVKLPDGTEVEDIGTGFNINAYSDEGSIKTTLIEGSIKIQNKLLQPGEQYKGGMVTKVNTEPVIAWRNGKFSFDNEDLKSTMRKLARWYDVQVRYEPGVPDSHFVGGTQMNKNLSEVLKVLELSGVHFKLEERVIVVYP